MKIEYSSFMFLIKLEIKLKTICLTSLKIYKTCWSIFDEWSNKGTYFDLNAQPYIQFLIALYEWIIEYCFNFV